MALPGKRVHINLFRVEPFLRLSVHVGRSWTSAALFQWSFHTESFESQEDRESLVARNNDGWLVALLVDRRKMDPVDLETESRRQPLLNYSVSVCCRKPTTHTGSTVACLRVDTWAPEQCRERSTWVAKKRRINFTKLGTRRIDPREDAGPGSGTVDPRKAFRTQVLRPCTLHARDPLRSSSSVRGRNQPLPGSSV